MRKQTKLVAVLSAAALLAIGASMTSFAAGWTEEDGTWVYYDNDGDRVTESWKKSGDHWYWLDDDGYMTTSELIEDDDNYYYVNENGAMVTNRWISIENEDAGEEDEPDVYWYYFQNSGKAYKASDSSTSTSFKTINGKKYAFDDEGRMLYGWVSGSERQTDDDAWQSSEYYCGSEDDGAMTTGWILLDIVDDNWDSDGEGFSSSNVYDDEEQQRWFYFKDNGKKMTDEKGKTINGRKYSFDEYGRMNAEWVIYDASPSVASQGDAEYSSNWRYYGDPEDGARVTKGWFQVVADENLNQGDYEDDDDAWYYSDKDGKLVTMQIKTINGKKYAFDEYGAMLDGLYFLDVNGSEIGFIYDDGEYDTEEEFDEFAAEHPTAVCYYFGDSDDGAMKTGKVTVEIDGDDFTFQFEKSGTKKGQGTTGLDDSKIYTAGKLLKADKDDKYKVVEVTLNDNGEFVSAQLIDTSDFVESSTYDEDRERTYYEIPGNTDETKYYLVNSSGTVVKSKSKCTDGDDFVFVVDDRAITAVYVED